MSNFKDLIQEMQVSGLQVPQNKVYIKIENAKEILTETMSYFLSLEGKQLIWIESYNEVVEWLENNEGRGLLLYGTCGQGKSVLIRYAIPAILLKYENKIAKCFNVQDMNKLIDSILLRKIICVDDIGTEDISNTYGNKRQAFSEIMDIAEKESKLVIVSSNLNADELKKVYGERIYDRLLATTKRVLFTGKSMRK